MALSLVTGEQKSELIETLGAACGMVVIANLEVDESSRLWAGSGWQEPIITASVRNRGQEFLNSLRALMNQVQAIPVDDSQKVQART